MKCSRFGPTAPSRRAWQLPSVCQPHFCKILSFTLIRWDKTVDSCSTWCSLLPPGFLPEGLLPSQLASSLYRCTGLPCPRCRNSAKFLLVQLKVFKTCLDWSCSSSVPATLNWLSSTDLQNVRLVSFPTFLSTLLMKILNNMGPSINPQDMQFSPVAVCMSSRLLLPFTSVSPRDLKPFATTRKAQESKMTWNANTKSYTWKSYLRWQRKKDI